jgi:hypothetical protein
MQTPDYEPIHVAIPGSPEDPRVQTSPDGIVVHRVPVLHPDDVVEMPNGLRVTSPARTLIDLAEVMEQDELREAFEGALKLGLLDMAEIRASRERVEWRQSLEMLDKVIAEFDDVGP